MMYEARKARSRPKYLSEELYQQAKAVLKDPEFIKKSKIQKANRCAGLDGVIRGTHNTGSIATVDHVDLTTSKNKGMLPSAYEVFMTAHNKKGEDGVMRFTSKKAEQINEKAC